MSKSASRLSSSLAEALPVAPRTRRGAGAVLDLVHLARQSLGDKDREIEILALFDQQAGQAMARLSALSGQDGAIAADLARMLAASARIAGAFRVATACHAYEAVALSSSTGDAGSAALEHLREEVTQVRSAIADLLTP